MSDKKIGPFVPMILPVAAPVHSPPGLVLGGDPIASDDTKNIKIYLDGLINRDCEYDAEHAKRYWGSPEGHAERKRLDERKAAFDRGDLRVVTMSERRKDGSSLKYVEMDRTAAREMIEAADKHGGTIGEDFRRWAYEK